MKRLRSAAEVFGLQEELTRIVHDSLFRVYLTKSRFFCSKYLSILVEATPDQAKSLLSKLDALEAAHSQAGLSHLNTHFEDLREYLE